MYLFDKTNFNPFFISVNNGVTFLDFIGLASFDRIKIKKKADINSVNEWISIAKGAAIKLTNPPPIPGPLICATERLISSLLFASTSESLVTKEGKYD